MKKLITLTIILISVYGSVHAQTDSSTREAEIKAEANRVMKNIDPMTGRSKPDSRIFSNDSLSVLDSASRENAGVSLNLEKSKKLLKIPSVYSDKFKEILKQKDTGLARIFADSNCEQRFVVSVANVERCANIPTIPGNGSYYSFARKSNYSVTDYRINNPVSSGWWDIHLSDGEFSVENCCAQEIISEIGNVNIENLDLSSPALTYLNQYRPQLSYANIKSQNEILAKGLEFNGFVYGRKAAAKLDSTYVLWTVPYKYKEEKDQIKIENDKNAMTIFRVVGKENDGSLILIWKRYKLNK